MNSQICDACRRLRLKCQWDLANPFAPCCHRCKKYGITCGLDGLTWPAWAQQAFTSTVPEGFSRMVYWGPASNAGGHPMDLHAPNHPPPEPQKKQTRLATIPPPPKSVDPVSIMLELSPSVRNHLYSIFFGNIQPVFPVVSRASLQCFPPTPLLEATILGTAARHHNAIASWRDLKHIKEVIAHELKSAVGLQQAYQPKIQTLQALLLLSTKPELATQGHGDITSISLRLSILCQMSRDLGIDVEFSAEHQLLHAILWKACLLQDAFLCATFGQPLNISIAPQVALDLCSSMAENQDQSYFLAAVEASHCLRHLLRTVYATGSLSEDDMLARLHQALAQIQHYDKALEAAKQDFTDYQYRGLRIFHHNNRLLFVLGLVGLISESHPKAQVSHLLSQEARSIIPEACQTLVWFSVEFLQSMPCRLDHLLYCESRAAMLIVDVLLEARRSQSLAEEVLQNLQSAITATRTLKDFLLNDGSWSSHWTQGHTLEAVLARLEDGTDQSRPLLPSELKKVVGLQPLDVGLSDTGAPQVALSQAMNYDIVFDQDLLNHVLFDSTDWDAVLTEYNEEYFSSAWLPQPQSNTEEFDGSSSIGDKI